MTVTLTVGTSLCPYGFSTVTEVNRGSTFALRRSTLDSGLGGQRGKPQNERQHSLSQFTRGEKPILVATDVAAR